MNKSKRIALQVGCSIAIVIISFLMFIAIDNVSIESELPGIYAALRLVAKSILAAADLICITLINLPKGN
ncbi:MAG: hypothetical protein J6K00_06115 [Oscillospiraceae bacterium]|jgi:hypothetical protein|nr:hypothetical protein [Oscillospiraceae bacterium]